MHLEFFRSRQTINYEAEAKQELRPERPAGVRYWWPMAHNTFAVLN